MLIKLVCDGSCGFVRRLGASEIRVAWVVEEGVPLEDVSHIATLNAAIDKSRSETADGGLAPGTMEVSDFSGYNIVRAVGGEPLDLQRTPRELGVSGGDTLHLVCATEPLQACVPLLHGREQSPQQCVNTEDDTDDDNDESYVSRRIGWFPFLLRPREGEPLALFIDPHKNVRETDPEPIVQPLCEKCCTIVSHGDGLRVAVDMHCKPALMQHEFLEVCMEKLGGGQLRRWQTRYVQMSDKSIDWFAEKPKPGVKSRIHGHRYILYDGECQVDALIDDPDPARYTQCGDKNFFHFGVTFRNPLKTYFFRVTTAQLRAAVLRFLALCIRRAKDKAPSHNPVSWKQQADAFLANAAELGELHSCNRVEIERAREGLRVLEVELAEMLRLKPKLQAALDTQANYVQALRADLTGYEVEGRQMQQRFRAAEARLAEEVQLLRAKELEMGDEVRKMELLKSHALQQRDSAMKRIAELRGQVAELQAEEDAVFRRWRSFEERHKRPSRRSASCGGMYSFSKDGVGVAFSSPRPSMELAASAARLTLSAGKQCSASPSPPDAQCSPSRMLRYHSASPKHAT